MRLVTLKDALALALPARGMPIILAQWASLPGIEGWESVLARANRVNGMDVPPPCATILPTGGMGRFGWPALEGHRDGTQFIIDPSGWQVEQGPDHLRLISEDHNAGLRIRLHFSLSSLLVMHSEIDNIGTTDYQLDRCMAGSLLIGTGAREITSFRGKWGLEFQETTEAAGRARWSLENRKGRTSHDSFPAVLIRDAEGGTHAAHLGWSGNHQTVLECLEDGRGLLHLGELFEPGEMRLAPGESYCSPKLYAAYDPQSDRTRLMRRFHTELRHNVLHWPQNAMRPRPVLLNTWEGNYFAHDITRLKQQASAARALGIERFVLDDGWFGQRNDDTTSLGDWWVDHGKYPHGLAELIDHVTGLGMEFGLWFEPEMVNVQSDLYRQHPDWVLQVEGRPLLESRHQQVLDLTRAEVSAYLFECLHDILRRHAISYIKWDMNRDLTHACGADGRAKIAAQTRAVYALMQRLREAHPAVEIESCASGGGRADYGVLNHTHRIWISDCTDALERLSIQRGARLFLPPEIMGCHISASPNHQTHRRHTLAFRAITAFFGHLGVELDLLALSQPEKDELRQWIALHKALRPLLHHPDSVSFDLPIIDNRQAFGVTLCDPVSGEERMILAIAQRAHPTHEHPMPLRLPVSQAVSAYTICQIGPKNTEFARTNPQQMAVLDASQPISGALLRHHGLSVPLLYPESAMLLEITTKGKSHG